MDADGTKDGYDLEMTRAVAEAVDIPVVASGGAGRPEHLCQALTDGKADAALAASIFHYNEYSIPATKALPGRARRAGPARLDAEHLTAASDARSSHVREPTRRVDNDRRRRRPRPRRRPEVPADADARSRRSTSSSAWS